MGLSETLIGIRNISSDRALKEIFTAVKEQERAINIAAASKFHTSQHVEFNDEGLNYKGTVVSISRAGRIKIDLIDNHYDNFTTGAGFLIENLK